MLYTGLGKIQPLLTCVLYQRGLKVGFVPSSKDPRNGALGKGVSYIQSYDLVKFHRLKSAEMKDPSHRTGPVGELSAAHPAAHRHCTVKWPRVYTHAYC